MSGAVVLAIVAAVGNLLQGWDNATLSGALSYLKKEFNFQTDPKLEGLILVTSPIASTLVTTFCGPISDSFGRRPLLIASSLCYFFSSLIMLWSPNVYVLLLARLLIGSGVGLTVTLVPLYISETAPSETRGLLNTFPQFTGSGGMFISNCMVFGISLMQNLSWRLMLGGVGIPSLIYFALILFFLPESPRWLVSKGRMAEAKKVLQRLRGREDVSSEMAFLVEGLDVGCETTIEEYIISPETELIEDQDPSSLQGQIKLYRPEDGLSWVARPLTGQSTQGSMQNPNLPLMDPLVTLFGSVHDKSSNFPMSTGEMAFLVEGLDVGCETTIEEYIISPETELIEDQDPSSLQGQIKLYRPEDGLSWVARPLTGQSTQGSMQNPNLPLMDPLVTLFGSVHDKVIDSECMRSVIFPTLGSMFSIGNHNHPKNEEWDEENVAHTSENDYDSDYGEAAAFSDDNLHSPLISRQTTTMEKDMISPAAHGTLWNISLSGFVNRNTASKMGIGSGWQLAWSWSDEEELSNGTKKGGFKRIYLHQEGKVESMRVSGVSITGENEFIKAFALASQPALFSKGPVDQNPVGPAMVHPSEAAAKGPAWSQLMEPGVKRALVVGMGIQLLQQFSGINGVLYYTPQILKQAGVGVLLSNLGISPNSASFLSCAFTTLLMLPCIAVAMRLMDNCGRRSLLLSTSPILITSLIILILVNVIQTGPILHAVISTFSVVTYLCVFVMGLGPIPNILCSEIFPTRVRGICIALCSLSFWIGNIIVTYSLPVMLRTVGFAGVFSVYAVFCVVAWVFVYLKVPETKGMPLEVITEFFALGARQTVKTTKN